MTSYFGAFISAIRRSRRSRCQVSAAHERVDLDQAVEAFQKVGKKFGVV
jgi:hypothetical protein